MKSLIWALAMLVSVSASAVGRTPPEPEPPAAAPAPPDTAPSDTAPPDAAPEEPDPVNPDVPRELRQQLDALRTRVRELEDDRDIAREQADSRERRLRELARLRERVGGYIDVGLFHVQGDGSGIRTDVGNQLFPEYAGVIPGGWVFLGDPLSTAINARGEPADTGPSRALRSDPVDAAGRPTFLVNTLSLSLFRGLSESVAVEATIDMLPRRRDPDADPTQALGQLFQVPRAYLEYIAPVSAVELHIYAGRFDSTVGREYRDQEAPDRISVTPSLLCRYVCGHALGVKARALSADGKLELAASVTNGGYFSENFRFSETLDSNAGKTGAARIGVRLPVGTGLELGVSGVLGSQDEQPADDILQWHIGADAALEWRHWVVRGEFVRGRAPGRSEPGQAACGVAPCLRYWAAYALLGYRARSGVIPYLRWDIRDALHRDGASFAYVSKLTRASLGVRKEFGPYIVAKLEYTVNRELGPLPQFDNDIVTSSLVARY